MQQISHAHSRLEPTEPDLAIIATTLGELIKAISEEVGPQEDHLVAEVVLHLLETGRIKFLNPMGEINLVWPI
ncbi:MAG: hypothetical protein PVH82_18290 [Desulfobacteraceae bacterium]|jgi:hypothetical protein